MADSKQASLVEPPGYSGSSPPSNRFWLSGCLLECGVGPHGTNEGQGRSVTYAGEKSCSSKISGLKGQMPVHTKPDVMFLGVSAPGRAVVTRLGTS